MLYRQKATLYSKVYDHNTRTDKYIRNVLEKVHFEGAHSFSFGNQTENTSDSFFAAIPYENDKILNLTKINPYIDDGGLVIPSGYPFISDSAYFLDDDYHLKIENGGLSVYQENEVETLVIRKGDIIVKGIIDLEINSIHDLEGYEYYVIKNVELLDYSIARNNHWEVSG